MNWIDVDDRPWGRWEEYLNEDGYRVKRIIVAAGERLSLQRHALRSEHWVIVAGSGSFYTRREGSAHKGRKFRFYSCGRRPSCAQ
jgi:mannose-6-phosphate isomerase-like protein (cupin superfamily)